MVSVIKQYKKTKIGKLPCDWEAMRLKDTSDIKFSSVDKKTFENEQPVLLCNYLDVYNNDYITRKINFMPATATEMEINKFTLLKGDILLTKDSETPDDIAIPSVVIEDLENVICGYHLAMLRPNPKLVRSIFLSKLLLSKPVNNQFIRLAHGLTRFGLNISAFEKVVIPVPPLMEQQKIAEILTTVDADIEKTDAIIKETQQLKKGLMGKLFTEGIGHTRFKKTKIGRIPEKWKTIKLKDVFKLSSGKARPKDFTPGYCKEKIYPIYGGNGIMGYSSEFNCEINTIILGRVGEYCGAVHRNNGKCWISDNALYAKEFTDNAFELFFLSLSIEYKNLNKYKSKSGQPLISQGVIYPLHLALPPIEEQRKISANILEIDNKIENEQNYKSELEQLKKGLLQVLLTGKIRVKV